MENDITKDTVTPPAERMRRYRERRRRAIRVPRHPFAVATSALARRPARSASPLRHSSRGVEAGRDTAAGQRPTGRVLVLSDRQPARLS
jgi:hypothetical protein